MKFSCEIDKNSKLKFYIVHNKSRTNIDIKKCIKYGQNQIQKYLEKYDLYIRPITRNDVKLLRDMNNSDNLCSNISSSLQPILSDLEDSDYNSIGIIKQEDSIRITFVLCHKSNTSKVIGIISSILNYKDPGFQYITGLEGFYTEIQSTNNLYIEIGCSSSIYKEIVTGTNYFIRIYTLLESINISPVNTIWGQVAGEVDGSKNKLVKLHKKRGCRMIGTTSFYECDTFVFLSEFFRRLNANELLKYTRYTKKLY